MKLFDHPILDSIDFIMDYDDRQWRQVTGDFLDIQVCTEINTNVNTVACDMNGNTDTFVYNRYQQFVILKSGKECLRIYNFEMLEAMLAFYQKHKVFPLL